MNKNVVTDVTFYNLDYDKFEQYKEDVQFLGLEIESFRVEDELYLNLILSGDYDQIRTFNDWLYSPENRASRTLVA